MANLYRFVERFLSCPLAVLAFLGGFSLLSLIIAIGAEAFFGVEPCVLCIYQRWPYAIVLLLSLIFLGLKRWLSLRLGIALSAVAFAANAVIAFYHTGVQMHWWVSFLQGCAVPPLQAEPQSILENIMSAPTADCADPSWVDPIFGLSIPPYNFVACVGLTAICILALYLSRRAQAHKTA